MNTLAEVSKGPVCIFTRSEAFLVLNPNLIGKKLSHFKICLYLIMMRSQPFQMFSTHLCSFVHYLCMFFVHFFLRCSLFLVNCYDSLYNKDILFQGPRYELDDCLYFQIKCQGSTSSAEEEQFTVPCHTSEQTSGQEQ